MSRWKLGSMVRINGLFHLLIDGGIPWGYNPLILTFDPNFLGHPSTLSKFNMEPENDGFQVRNLQTLRV